MLESFKNNQFIFNYRRMWPFIKPYWVRGLLGILLTIPVGALDAAVAAFLKPITDDLLVARDPQLSSWLPFIILAFTLVQGGFSYAAGYVNAWVGSKVSMGVTKTLYDKLLTMDSKYYDQHISGEILFRYSGDPGLATGGLISNLKLLLTKFFSTIALVVVMVYNSWELTIISLGVFALAIYPVKLVKGKIKNITQESVTISTKFITLYNETFNGSKIIKAYTLEEEFQQKFDRTQNYIFRLGIKMTQGAGWLSPLLHFIGSIGLALVLGLGTHFIINKTITPGNFIAFIGAMLMLYRPLKSIGGNYVRVHQAFLAIDRIFEILNTKPPITSNSGTVELTAIGSNIEFKNINFGYTQDVPVLKDVSFQIKVGQTVALVGNSGGGKTTIGSLLPRLYEIDSGQILIDGLDIRDYTIKSLRQNIAMVFQDNFLFSGTLRENLAFGGLGATESQMWAALANANLDEFVRSTERGLDTIIGERGVLLSGGQKQRVAIARAFLKDAPLVILDEATSALDNKSEKVVQEALDRLMKNRTVIVIAHRLSTVQNADNILVINDGRIMEQGCHEELLARRGAYYGLYSTQFGG